MFYRALTIPLLDHLISEMDMYFDASNNAVMASLLCVLPALLSLVHTSDITT